MFRLDLAKRGEERRARVSVRGLLRIRAAAVRGFAPSGHSSHTDGSWTTLRLLCFADWSVSDWAGEGKRTRNAVLQNVACETSTLQHGIELFRAWYTLARLREGVLGVGHSFRRRHLRHHYLLNPLKNWTKTKYIIWARHFCDRRACTCGFWHPTLAVGQIGAPVGQI